MNERVNYVVTAQEWDDTFEEVSVAVCRPSPAVAEFGFAVPCVATFRQNPNMLRDLLWSVMPW